MKDYIPLNFAIISHPLNWLIIPAFVLIFVLGLNLIFPTAGTSGSDQ